MPAIADCQQQILDSPAMTGLGDRVDVGGPVAVAGAVGSSSTMVTAALRARRPADAPILHVVAHLDEADEVVDELAGLGVQATRCAALELLGSGTPNLDVLAERLALVRMLQAGSPPPVIVASVQALMQAVPDAEGVNRAHRAIVPGQTLDLEELAGWLADGGYARVASVENPGEFAVRGGIIDVFAPGSAPVRLDLFGDELEGIAEIDLDSMGSDRRLERVDLVTTRAEQAAAGERGVGLVELLPDDTVVVLAEAVEIDEQARGYFERVTDAAGIVAPGDLLRSLQRLHASVEINRPGAGTRGTPDAALPLEPLPHFDQTVTDALRELVELGQSMRVVVLCQNDGERQRMEELVAESGTGRAVTVQTRYLHRGFAWRGEAGDDGVALVPYHELLHRYQMRRRTRRMGTGRALDTFLDLQPGEHVVHRDHGIARFVGLQMLTPTGADAPEEFLTLEFAGRAKVHVPASKIELVQKYIGAYKGQPELSTIGGKRWGNQKQKVRDAVHDLAAEMLRMQAVRESMPGISYPPDTLWQREFEAEFPYVDTDDQVAATAAVKRRMNDPQPMDQLICGDVGFGKTEIAIRAAFKAAEFGKQVAILVPTTVLAEQHERTFRERFADYPFRVESVSRFKAKAKQRDVLELVAKGQVDIVIGTHRLLSKDVRFADLGLVVIDEEQRFGVEHKQRLLEFRTTADVLTLSATPIPRTLHMALLGLRDISSLTTPPLDRRAIVTEVQTYDERRIKQAIERELAREGQVYFVHNRVYDIQSVADDVRRMVPDARVIVGHGQMAAGELEKVMLAFIRREADILVCTTIIESGIDIPTVNTMFVDDAHMFGLSELHQLRGRVGRYKHRAYCYLLLAPDKVISPEAMKRLRALETYSMLGAGFKIALRDLELRGAGNLLGSEQSGHIAVVGYEMYCQLLEEAVNGLKSTPAVSTLDTVVDIGLTGSIPKGFIPSDIRRMDAYRRISRTNDLETLDGIERDLISAYGELPQRVETLIELARIRVSATLLGIVSVTRHDDDIIFRTGRPDAFRAAMEGAEGTLRLVGQPDEAGKATVYYRPPPSYFEGTTLLAVLRRRLTAAVAGRGRAAADP